MASKTTRFEVLCGQCNSPFSTTPFRVSRGQGRFCSVKCRGAAKFRPPADRFWDSVDKSGVCWIWTGGVGVDGYASFFDGKRNTHASRFSWSEVNGPIPEGLCILHNCPGGDNPLCVNPDHLRSGTKRDNYHDMANKGRLPDRRGSLSRSKVPLLRDEYRAGGITIAAMAQREGVSIPTMWRALKGKTFKL